MRILKNRMAREYVKQEKAGADKNGAGEVYFGALCAGLSLREMFKPVL